jgi:DnaK suppressor protein
VDTGGAGKRLAAERSALSAQIEALEQQFQDFVESAELVATDDEHDPEGHTIAFERQQVAALLQEARRKLTSIDDAQRRLAAGTYGCCEGCGEPIGPERLEALPEATHCIGCAH